MLSNFSNLKILSLNVCGLKSKLIHPEFIDLLNQYDIIGLQESKLDDIDIVDIKGFQMYSKNRTAVSRYRSGGITLLIKENLVPFVTVLKNDSKLVLWFLISKHIMPSNSDLLCGVIYIPPIGSKYSHRDPYLELQYEYDKFCSNNQNVLLLGDLNSRSSQLSDIVKTDSFICDVYGNQDLYRENMEIIKCFDDCNLSLSRKNDDKTTNSYGQQLIEFCKNNNIFILNGRFGMDSAKLTCKNSSTVDYALTTAFNFEMISSFHVLDFDALFSDAHCPIAITLDIKNSKPRSAKPRFAKNEPEVRLWDDEKRDLFIQNIDSEEIQNIDSILNSLSLKNDINCNEVNTIVGLIENLFVSNAATTFGVKQKVSDTEKSQKTVKRPWFNTECYKARNSYHKIRKLYNKYKTNHYKNLLKQVSKEYKNKMASNFRRHKNENIQKLRNLKNAKPKEFWRVINSIDKSKNKTAPLQTLYEYFKKANAGNLNDETEDDPADEQFLDADNNNDINDSLDQPFTEAEISSAVKGLKNSKSQGIDNILNEHIKSTIHVMSPIYVKLFNLIFENGIVPENWTIGNILPIYKNKGDSNAPENYRPITLLSCFGKLFTSILNNRINQYFEENDAINSCQAGFRKGFSTTDNLYIIQSLIEISQSSKQKLFCAFVDFRQAFDTVWRNGLWQKLLNTNVNGNCFKFIKNMYIQTKSRVKTSEGASAFFPSMIGVRQGENLSPLLFSVYLNDLHHYLSVNGVPGVECGTDPDDSIMTYIKILVLLFADDTVLFGNSKEDLQYALDKFENYCDKWRLTVNTSKTKVMIFSKGRLPKNVRFHFKNEEIEIVNEYKYLGIFLARSGSFLNAKKHIVNQANNALFSLQRKIRNLNLPIDMQIDLFNKMIKPILLYGCEIWGFGNLDIIERVQLKFYKQILYLKKSTPSFMVYGELGAYPLFIDIQSRIISFWCKVNNNLKNDTAKTIYDLIYYLNEKEKLNSPWLNHIRKIINTNGFGNVWTSQNNVNSKWFINAFKQKLKDQYIQTWNALVNQSSSGKNYQIFKDTFTRNTYFSFLSNKNCRLLTALRTRNHHFPIELGRWTSTPLNERICNLCRADVGDEFHYILACNFFHDTRKQFIKPYYYRNTNTIKFNQLMNSSNKTVIKNLCAFTAIIMKTFKDD